MQAIYNLKRMMERYQDSLRQFDNTDFEKKHPRNADGTFKNNLPIIDIDVRHLENLPDLSNTNLLLEYIQSYLTPTDTNGNVVHSSVVNKFDGERLYFFKNSLSASLSKIPIRGEKAKINAIARSLYKALPDILENAKPVEGSYEVNTKPSSKGHIAGYETYSANIRIREKIYHIEIGVDVPVRSKKGKLLRGKGYYYHYVSAIKKVN